MSICPQCGGAVPPGRVFCRPSCRAKFQHAEATRAPRLFRPELVLENELPSEDDVREARRERKRQ